MLAEYQGACWSCRFAKSSTSLRYIIAHQRFVTSWLLACLSTVPANLNNVSIVSLLSVLSLSFSCSVFDLLHESTRLSWGFSSRLRLSLTMAAIISYTEWRLLPCSDEPILVSHHWSINVKHVKGLLVVHVNSGGNPDLRGSSNKLKVMANLT